MSSLQSRTPTGLRQGDSGDGNGRSPMLEISNSMVRVYKEAFGRGPTKARAYFAGPDILVVLLADSLTVAERNLAAMGEHERLRQSRIFFQHAMEEQFRVTVERVLGRRTLAFMSGIDTQRDISAEIFVLEPQAETPEAAGSRTIPRSSRTIPEGQASTL